MAKKDSQLKQNPRKSNSKEKAIFNNLLKITMQFVAGKGFKTLSETELQTRLTISPQHNEIFHQILNHLMKTEVLSLVDGRYIKKESHALIVAGTLKMNPRGFGFVQPNNTLQHPQDIFIPKHLTKNGVDGDVVEVEINQESISEKGPEGKIISILSRARTHMAGTIVRQDVHKQWIVHVPILGPQQRVIVEANPDISLNIGDRIVMQVIDWGSKESETICIFSHNLGNISDPSCDIYAAIEEFELRADFPSHVIDEAACFGNRVALKAIKEREDFRNLTSITIDPDTAKDFDDALSLTKDDDGCYKLIVHIADVSHYVQPGSALDDEARLRCNSTYFPNYCLPMLPSILSDNLCSLKPNVNRLTVSVVMTFDQDGTLIDHRMTRSVIRSAKRFSYREAYQVLQGKKKNVHLPLLQLMVELCQLLKKQRHKRGCIEFSLPELVVIVDEQGMPYKTDYVAYDITHQMVEEFMLKANEIVAWELTNQGKNLTYRIHDEPAEENLRDFATLAAAFGFKIPDYPNPQDLQQFFEEASKTTYANYLAASYIRRMRLASYSAENIGHYGLSLSHYCHFTSPIRRYMDLVVHRILFGEASEITYLQEIAASCSGQERISAKAEQNVTTLKKLRLLQAIHLKDPSKEFEVIITRVKNFGIYFEVMELFLEGFIHISELEEDYFLLEESFMRLRGVRYGSIYAVGDRLLVMVQNIELILQETKWMLASQQITTKPHVLVQPHHRLQKIPRVSSKSKNSHKTTRKKPQKK